MATATFSGHSSYQLEAVAVRSGKDIYVDVYVNRVGSYLAWSTAQQAWGTNVDGVVNNTTWTYDFRNSTRVYLGRHWAYNRAIGTRGWSATVNMASGIGSATVGGYIEIPPDAPSAPTLGTVTRNSDTSHSITWSRNAPANAPYSSQQVQRREYDSAGWGGFTSVASLSATATSYTDTSTVANRLYQYRVVAFNSAGSAASASGPWTYTTPTAPGVTLAATSATQVTAEVTPKAPHADYKTELQYSSAGGAWTTLTTLASGVKTYTWTPPAAASIRVRARTVIVAPTPTDPGHNLASAYTESNLVPLQSPPLAPTSLTPNGVNVDFSKTVTLSWTYTSTDTSDQTAYEIETKAGAGAWTSRGKVTSSAKERTFAAGTFAKGVAQQWRVKTWGVSATASPTSNPASFTAVDAPAVTITSPIGVAEVATATVTWTPVAGQANWKAELYRESELVESKSGSGSASTTTFTTPFMNGSTYTIKVQVQASSGLWSPWASTTFGVDFPTPAPAGVALGWDTDRGAVLVTIDNPTPTPVNLMATNPSFEAAGAAVNVRTNLATDPLQISAGGQANNPATWQVTKNVDMPAGNPQGITKGLRTTPQAGATTTLLGSFYNLDSLQTIGPVRHVGVWVYVPSIGATAQFIGYGPAVSVPANTWVWVTTTTPIPGDVQINFGIERLNGNPATPGTHVAYVTGATALAYNSPTEAIWGGRPASGDFTYVWTGTPNASTSVQRALSVGGLNPNYDGTGLIIQSSEWASSGSKSVRIIPTLSIAYFYSFAYSWGLQVGKTYTISAKTRIVRTTSSVDGMSRSLAVMRSGPIIAKATAPNEIGVHQLSVTFTMAADDLVIFYSDGIGDTWWDDLIITEGTDVIDYFDGDTPGARWTGTPNASTSTRADAVSNNIYRSYDGITWELVAEDLPLDAVVADPEVRLNDQVFYRVLTASPLGTVTESTVRDIWTSTKHGYWAAGAGFNTSIAMRVGLGEAPRLDLESGLVYRELHRFAGRRLPVEYAGVARQRSGEATFVVESIDERDQAMEMSYIPAPHLFRRQDGIMLYASIGEVSSKRVGNGLYEITVPLTEVER